MRRNSASRFHRFYTVITREKVCVYCGVRATTVDHFVPLSVIAMIQDAINEITGKVLVPACGECNMLAGDDVFPTIAAKRRAIHAKLTKRYQKVLAMPKWAPEDVEDMGHSMREFILAGERQREWVKSRLAWRNTSTSIPVEIAHVKTNIRTLRRVA